MVQDILGLDSLEDVGSLAAGDDIGFGTDFPHMAPAVEQDRGTQAEEDIW